MVDWGGGLGDAGGKGGGRGMSEKADKAYAEAAREIARVKAEGGTSLSLFGDKFRALERLPDEIANWTGLQFLFLSGTQITDARLVHVAGLTGLQFLVLSGTQITDAGLVHVAGLTGLQSLVLSGTQITDAGLVHVAGLTGLQILDLMNTQITDAGMAHVAGLTGLQSLDLMDTQITDAGLAHVAGLTALQRLDLRNTQVRDLRPICDLPFDNTGNALSGVFGLRFEDTPAAELDETLGQLAGIADHKGRTEKTLAYLRGLPRWPLPLDGGADPIPAGKPAPLQVIERDGKLVALRSETELDAASDVLAAQAWAALRNFLEDMADQRARIHNMMPTMAKALARFEDALASQFSRCDPIALGMHGNRIVRLAPSATEYLNAADAAEVTELAAAIALFLERFPAWRRYRDDANPPAYSAQDVAAVIPLIRALDAKLRDHAEIDPDIPNQLDLLTDAATDAPEDGLSTRGLLDSFGNVVSALAIKALTISKLAIKMGLKGTWKVTKVTLDKSADVALNLAATDYFVNNAENLSKLAAKLPAIFEWLSKFLSTLPFYPP